MVRQRPPQLTSQWSRIAPTLSLVDGIKTKEYMKRFAMRSRIPPADPTEGLRFGQYVRILSLQNVSLSGKTSSSQRIELLREFATLLPNVEHLVCGPTSSGTRHGPFFGYWPRLRSLYRIHGSSVTEDTPGASEMMVTRLSCVRSMQTSLTHTVVCRCFKLSASRAACR